MRIVVHARAAQTLVAELVVLLAFVGVAEDFVGLGAFLELGLGFFVVGILVGVILHRQSAIGPLDIVGGCILG